MPKVAELQRSRTLEYRAACAWIRKTLPADTVIIVDNDPVLYLYSGRRSIGRPLPPRIWYEEDGGSAIRLYRELEKYAREHNTEYFLRSSRNPLRDVDEKTMIEIEGIIR